MSKWNPIDKDLKQKILNSINLDGLSVTKASQEYWVTTKTIYNWLNKSITQNSSEKATYAELSRLRKDKDDLLLIIWRLTKELKDTKKSQKIWNWISKKDY